MSEKDYHTDTLPSTGRRRRDEPQRTIWRVGFALFVSFVGLAVFGRDLWMGSGVLKGKYEGATGTSPRDIFQESPLIDTHNDFPIFIRAFFQNDIYQKNFTSEATMPRHVDFPRLRAGKLGAQFWSAFVECPQDNQDHSSKTYLPSIHDTLQQIDLVHRLVSRFPSHLVSARTASDIRNNFAAYGSKRISSLIGIEGLHQIGNSASILRLYHELGVRYATLTHVCHNAYADSEAPPETLHGGLSSAGVELVREMNRMGMIVDLSHTSADTQRQALNVSLAPVMFSHSNAYALREHTRNVPDDVLRLVKQNDGVVMTTFLPDYIKNPEHGDASRDDVADHIQYIGDLIGYRHVGIGSDFDGMLGAPEGLEDVSKYPELIAELLNRGVAESDVKNVMGLNAIRVFEAAEKTAAELAPEMDPLQDKIEKMG